MPIFLSRITIVILFLLPIPSFAEVDGDASKVADTYLRALKIIELPEGKDLFAEVSWGNEKDVPVFTDSSIIFEGMFLTDVEGIQGYKRLMEIKVLSKSGVPLVKRYILVSYKDRVSQKWKVYSLREVADAEYEAMAAKKSLHVSPPSEQANYRRYGYWSMMAGKISQAYEAFKTASELNRRNPEQYVTQEEFDLRVQQLGRILSR